MTPGWRRKRKTGGSETAPLRKIRTGWRDGGGCCIRGCGWTRASEGLRAGRFDRLRTGSPRTVSRVALTGRGRFETGPYARSGRGRGVVVDGMADPSPNSGGYTGVCLSPWRDLCITRQVVARKTPHRFRPKTPESASPPGEGKEWRLLEGIDTAHPPAKTAAASPRGEARDCVPEDGGYAKVSLERVKIRSRAEGEEEDGRVGDAAPTKDRDADAGMAGGRG